VSKECPWRIDIEFGEGEYFQNETMDIKIKVYDKEKNLMPNADFNLDLVVANRQVKTTLHSTSGNGIFEKRNLVSEPTGDGSYEYARYIAKSSVPGCKIVSDTEALLFYVSRPPPSKTALSVFKIDPYTVNVLDVSCGNGKVEAGEACEGNEICRVALGCNYEKRTYDFPEVCNSCKSNVV